MSFISSASGASRSRGYDYWEEKKDFPTNASPTMKSRES